MADNLDVRTKINKVIKMILLKKIQEEIRLLPQSEFKKLRDWIIEQDWNEWDQQIEKDVSLGKLDFLIEEAKNENKAGILKAL